MRHAPPPDPHGPSVRQLDEALAEWSRDRSEAAEAAAFFSTAADAIVCANRHGVITRWNAMAQALFGYTFREAVGQPLTMIVPPGARLAHEAGFARAASGGPPMLIGRTVRVDALTKSGELIPVELSLARWETAEGPGFGAIMRDLRARLALEEERAATQRFLDTVIRNLPLMIFAKDAETGRYRLWNRAARAITGRSAKDVIGRTDVELFGETGALFMDRDRHTLSDGLTVAENPFTRSDGEIRILRTRRRIIRGQGGEPAFVLGITEDVTERREMSERLSFLAGHDPLTRLANRDTLLREADRLLREREAAAMVVLRVERLSAIAESQGRIAADRVLERLAAGLRNESGPGDLAARTGFDECALLSVGADAATRVQAVAERLVDAFAPPLELGAGQVKVAIRAGLATTRMGSPIASLALLDRASAALADAATGAAPVTRSEARARKDARRRRTIERLLPAAIARRAIACHYQPIVGCASRQPVAVEALARWELGTGKSVAPDHFIALAEANGLIEELGQQLLRQAMLDAGGWAEPLPVAVNLSPVQLERPGFVPQLATLLTETRLPPARLELELTENVLIRDAAAVLDTLRQVRALGCGVVLDDFGSGYSSLRYFRDFPFTKLKIDREFTRGLQREPGAAALVRAAIAMGHGFGLAVVAEGVEDEAQLDMLTMMGCDSAQGYLLGRPMPGAMLDTFLSGAQTAAA